jgi:putative membrane protein
MGHPYWEHAGNGHPFLWFLFFLLLAVVVGLVAAFVLRRLGDRPGRALPFQPAALGPPEDALGIVRMRYARGEIDREQFLQTTADLGGAGGYPVAEPPPGAPKQ